jgi:hypothetical protein
MAAAVAVPFALLNIASWGCCAVSAASSVCCSLASCFGFKYDSRMARLVYLFMFLFSAVRGREMFTFAERHTFCYLLTQTYLPIPLPLDPFHPPTLLW